ncbi:MAG TPA: hypothetical protein VFG50_05495 [Rhodothermales bacterium]|nr:hypothetical protein [Rhodothermales bacterium]
MQDQEPREKSYELTDDPLAVSPAPAETAASQQVEAGAWDRHHLLLATLSVLVVLFVLVTVTGRIDTLAHNIAKGLVHPEPAVADVEEPAEPDDTPPATTFTFKDLDIHPDVVYASYTTGPLLESAATGRSKMIHEFRDLIALYQQRQGEDDNFTIRVIDNRSNKLLELYVLDRERDEYHETGDADWYAVDQIRRRETRRLVDKYAGRGIPRGAVTVKWGRADQVRQARKKELNTIEYEVRLARFLGMSLLPTEIGTVETFNQDRLVSSVGARSRYQMMPYLLRQNGIRHYSLRTAAGNSIPVYEEWNPLLTMEPAFLTLKGYINAVGHEIPGLSAYHTGPGNIFMVYRTFLSNHRNTVSPNTTVMDAYMWAVTDGFDTVSKGTSFGSYSRGYVASAYGSLRAMENEPIDTTNTLLTERVQLKNGKQVFLSQLLRTLGKHIDELNLRGFEGESLYSIFRKMNPHISLPEPEDSLSVPIRGDVNLTARADGADVRFFLPLGSVKVLKEAGMAIIDPDETFEFNHNTYTDPSHGVKTMWDRQYDDLVRDIGHFGFTSANRARLTRLADKFAELAAISPSHYREDQMEVIKLHEWLWDTGPWDDMAAAVEALSDRLRPQDQPITPLPTTPSSEFLSSLR